MVKRAFLEFMLDYNGKLIITGDTPNGKKLLLVSQFMMMEIVESI
jgi:hypothetical protein